MSKEIQNQEIKQLSQIEHVLKRPSMYIGSIVQEPQQEFCLSNNDIDELIFKQDTREYVPGLIKVMNEWIDNSIDEYVRTNGKFANKITINMTNNSFECQDNGRGIPNVKMKTLNDTVKYQAEVAFTEMLSGANYENDDEATIGTNGLGSKAGSIFAKKTTIVNDDGKMRLSINTKDNLSSVQIKETDSKQQGIRVKMYPDLEYFNKTELTETDFSVIKERLIHLSMAYPGISFRFDHKSLKMNPKNYFKMFGVKELITEQDYTIGVTHADSEQFEHFSLMNGLVTKKGGTAVNVITNDIVYPIRDKLIKKFKTIKPSDIKNKLRVVVVMNNFMNARYTSQTKDEITNSEKEIREYLNKDYKEQITKLSNKILKNPDIMEPITELFLLKEQAKENAQLKKLSRTKKLKLEKYLPSTKEKKVLFLCEGACLEENTELIVNDKIKKIKDVKVGDLVITRNLKKKPIISITKQLKNTKKIVAGNDTVISSGEHRFLVYNKKEKCFGYSPVDVISQDIENYMLLKSKVPKLKRQKVLQNDCKLITLEGIIYYTDKDKFLIAENDEYKVIKGEDIDANQEVLSYED